MLLMKLNVYFKSWSKTLFFLFQVLVCLHHPHCNAGVPKEAKKKALLVYTLGGPLKCRFVFSSLKFGSIP